MYILCVESKVHSFLSSQLKAVIGTTKCINISLASKPIIASVTGYTKLQRKTEHRIHRPQKLELQI